MALERKASGQLAQASVTINQGTNDVTVSGEHKVTGSSEPGGASSKSSPHVAAGSVGSRARPLPPIGRPRDRPGAGTTLLTASDSGSRSKSTSRDKLANRLVGVSSEDQLRGGIHAELPAAPRQSQGSD